MVKVSKYMYLFTKSTLANMKKYELTLEIEFFLCMGTQI